MNNFIEGTGVTLRKNMIMSENYWLKNFDLKENVLKNKKETKQGKAFQNMIRNLNESNHIVQTLEDNIRESNQSMNQLLSNLNQINQKQ